jgi:hypothetical protein
MSDNNFVEQHPSWAAIGLLPIKTGVLYAAGDLLQFSHDTVTVSVLHYWPGVNGSTRANWLIKADVFYYVEDHLDGTASQRH